MKIKFIPIDYDYFDFNEKNYVKMIGRDEKGRRICVIDEYKPNFWVIFEEGVSDKKIKEVAGKIEKIETENSGRKAKVLKVEEHNKKFLGKDVKALRVFVTNHKDSHALADQLDLKEIAKRREYDISLTTKYIKEKKVSPLTWYDIEGELLNGKDDFGGLVDVLEVDSCVLAEKIKESEKQEEYKPRILAYDIEVDEFELGKGHVILISLYGLNEKVKKVLTWKKCEKKQDFVECFEDESEMLEAFVKYVKEYDTDFLAGYFSDGFDLPYLRSSAQKNKIKLSLGLDGSSPTFAKGRIPSGKIDGIVHIDLFRFIETAYSQYLQSETLSLDEVGKELIGEEKKDFSFSKLGRMTEDDWKDLFAYNLQDSLIAYKLAEKIWPDMLEFSRIMRRPIFDVTRDKMSANVENYIYNNLDDYNEIFEKRPLHDEIGKRKDIGKYEGAFVFEPVPGLYENLAMFDFTSMYASVIVTYNLSLATLQQKREKDSLEVDLGKNGKALFSKEKGFFPLMLEGIIEKRKKHKKEYKENPSALLKATSNAYKLLANAAYGYQGFFGARYYCREAAASTAALARKNIFEAIDKIKKESYEIVYSDTDSIAFLLGDKTKKDTLEFLKKMNSELPGIMELELEDFYDKGLFVSKRTTAAGAKKKYALITHNKKVKIRGFETVRRDWCELARELQSNVLDRVLEDGNEKKALEIFKKVVEGLKKRKIDMKKVMIRTQLKKSITGYIAEGPHVIAAKKMEEQGIPVSQGMVIEYFIAETREKKKLVREKVKLPNEKGEYNIEYYLNNQIIPAVENIFEVFGINVKEVVEGSSQKKLF